jgi:hypothetical protein
LGLSWAKPGRRNIKGETVWTAEMPAHPVPTNTKAAPRAKHLKIERSFTGTILRCDYDLGNPIVFLVFVREATTKNSD